RAPRNGYSAWSYQMALQEGLLPVYDGTLRFQQDNSGLHNAASTQTWLQEHGVEYIDWPPFSPDLNPIEHAWALLKRAIRRKYPHLRHLKDNELDRAEFIECAKVAWAEIPQGALRGLIESMPNRLRAVIGARGWYTKY